MIKAVIFDCFGVLTTDAWLPFKQSVFGHDPELMEQATNLNRNSGRGLISYDDFLSSISALSSIPAAEVRRAVETNIANQPLFRYIEELRKDYKIGLLSNASGNRLFDIFDSGELAVFDEVVLSYEIGVIKPSPRAYEIIAERLGLEVRECVLIDDQERNCVGAREAGMKAILYRADVEELRAELSRLLQK